jgi:hypothetical protein
LLALSRSRRGFLVLGFSLLMLGMQQESLRHALTHFKPAQEEQQLSSLDTGVVCLECALLAAGSAALPSAALSLIPDPGTHVLSLLTLVAPVLTRFTPNRSRAPPSLS